MIDTLDVKGFLPVSLREYRNIRFITKFFKSFRVF